MADFCSRCGRRIEPITGFCPVCDADKFNGKTNDQTVVFHVIDSNQTNPINSQTQVVDIPQNFANNPPQNVGNFNSVPFQNIPPQNMPPQEFQNMPPQGFPPQNFQNGNFQGTDSFNPQEPFSGRTPEPPLKQKPNNRKRTVALVSIICSLCIVICTVLGIFIFGKDDEDASKKDETKEIKIDEYIPVFEDMLNTTTYSWNEGVEDFSKLSIDVLLHDYVAEVAVTHGMINYFTYVPFEEPVTTPDPKKKMDISGEGVYSYYVVDADIVDWVITNVFGGTPNRSVETDTFYYYGDKFYFCEGFGGGPTTEYKVLSYKYLGKNKYEVSVVGYCETDVILEFYYKFIVSPEFDKQKGKYWRFYSYEFLEDATTETPIGGSTTSEPNEDDEIATENNTETPSTSIKPNLNNTSPTPGNDAPNIWKEIPNSFSFSSGAGAWGTGITINDDGSFTGEYHDSNAGDTGPNYPNGSVYICSFSGKFGTPKKVSEYIYTMKLEELNLDEKVGKEYYEDGRKYICTEPYGFDDANEFYIYLPGTPISQMDEEFIGWAHFDTEAFKALPIDRYGIYNISGKLGFIGSNENTMWSKDYYYRKQSYEVALWPSNTGFSHLLFWPPDSAAIIDATFVWDDKNKKRFIATDSNWNGDFEITVDVKDDLSSIAITVISKNGVDLSPWGGTKDGKFVAELKEESSY